MWDDIDTSAIDYIVFDDMVDPIHKIHDWKSWISRQLEAESTDKFQHAKAHRWGKPCIIIANEHPGKAEDGLWWNKHVTTVILDSALF
ncbi:hypothetical protein EDB81DRAFT_818984 [Dactylonectria macrodidyma]|uniref:Uncharacterized protein n=1 Tax=Dactylonectria macrodidyma TaxID=307937 RepID=A0A9P9ICC7_9HYPO|nr:hypothetical protein EDB81DRAFT_818984 [Dactylonectria macrodidyma]